MAGAPSRQHAVHSPAGSYSGLSKSIKQSANGTLGTNSTSALILSVVRSLAPISPRMMPAIRQRFQFFWIRSRVCSLTFWQRELMIENQHLICLPLGSTIEAKTPPSRNAVQSPNAVENPTERDSHIAEIATRRRMAWGKTTGYNQRNRGETLPLSCMFSIHCRACMGRWKVVARPELKARTYKRQKAEIGGRVLNRMTGLGRPSFERTA